MRELKPHDNVYIGTKFVEVDSLSSDFAVWTVATIYGETGSVSCRGSTFSTKSATGYRVITNVEIDDNYLTLKDAQKRYPEYFI